MDFHEEREGREEIEDNGFNDDGIDDDEAEDDELEEAPINLLISCQQAEERKPCTNLGKCMIFDQATGTFSICEHLLIEDSEEDTLEWEEN